MNLATKIKDQLRLANGIDYNTISKAVEKIFMEHPDAEIHVGGSSRFNVSDKDYRGMWSIDVPHTWMPDIKAWAEGNGFKIQERRLSNGHLSGFFIHLI